MVKKKNNIEQELEKVEIDTAGNDVFVPKRPQKSLTLGSMVARHIGWKKGLIILVVIVGWVGTFYFYESYSSLKNDPQIAAQMRAAQTITELASVIEIPTNELPSLATITDESLLSKDVFFEKAEKGDVLVVYTQAQKVYLYRPTLKKVINVGTFVNNSVAVPTGAFERRE